MVETVVTTRLTGYRPLDIPGHLLRGVYIGTVG